MEVKRATGPADRCQFVTRTGQCNCAREGLADFCASHGGAITVKPKRIYALTHYKARLERFADDPNRKTLHEELGILRMMLESILNRCSDDHELIMQSGPISELVGKVERLVISADKLDQRAGQLLDKSVLLKFASSVVDIIANHFGDDPRVNQVADDILKALGDKDENNSEAV